MAAKKRIPVPELRKLTLEEESAFRRVSVEMQLRWSEETFTECLSALVKRLHHITDEVEQMVTRRDVGDVALVERIQHDVLWGVANLGLDTLTGYVYRVQEARARKEKSDASEVS